MLISRINFSPDGRIRWTGFFKYPHFGPLGLERFQILTGTANSGNTNRELATNLMSNLSYMCKKMRLTSFFTPKMAFDYNRSIILSWIKIMNCFLTIAVEILSPNIKFVLQMRINIGVTNISKMSKKSHNYPHSSQILLIKFKMT